MSVSAAAIAMFTVSMSMGRDQSKSVSNTFQTIGTAAVIAITLLQMMLRLKTSGTTDLSLSSLLWKSHQIQDARNELEGLRHTLSVTALTLISFSSPVLMGFYCTGYIHGFSIQWWVFIGNHQLLLTLRSSRKVFYWAICCLDLTALTSYM